MESYLTIQSQRPMPFLIIVDKDCDYMDYSGCEAGNQSLSSTGCLLLERYTHGGGPSNIMTTKKRVSDDAWSDIRQKSDISN
mmetsp:Transcript_19290/g.34932  ORF Transcript_19290/g.34932 Transcript_19290/m.34932 type:complete len:82 (+) Transcript_19290:270-515(+)